MGKTSNTYDPNNFISWFRHEKYVIILTLLCAIIPIIITEDFGRLLESVGIKTDDDDYSFIGLIGGIFKYRLQYQVANILFILAALIVLSKMKFIQERDEEKIRNLHEYAKNRFGQNNTLARNTPEALFARINAGIKQFYYSWVSVWIIWLTMYIVKLVFSIYQEVSGDHLAGTPIPRIDNLLENSLNLLSSFILLFIYLDITVSTVNIGTLTGNGKRTMHVGIIFILLLGTVIFTTDLFSIFIADTLYHDIQFFLRLVIGMVATISIMAVFGRLNTSYLKIPQLLIMCLYLYATIQMFYPLTHKPEKEAFQTTQPIHVQVQNSIVNINGTSTADVTDTWKERNDKKPKDKKKDVLEEIQNTIAFIGKGCILLVLLWISKQNRFMFFLLHKANSLSDSDFMLRNFKKSYEGCPDK